MKTTAVIAEYNPLHNGHVQHLEAVRRDTGADYIIAVMSGDFVQRGCPAVISKYERARSALYAGADLVLELPLCYSVGSLEYFAAGAVSLVAATGIADCLSFGSECGSIDALNEAAAQLYRLACTDAASLRSKLTSGYSYALAINSLDGLSDEVRKLLRSPNNLLASSYICAALRSGFNVNFHTVRRSGSGYHDISSGALSSSSLRQELINERNHFMGDGYLKSAAPRYTSVMDRMPEPVYNSLTDYFAKYPPLCEDDLSLLLFYKLQECIGEDRNADELNRYLDVSGNLTGRIIGMYKHASSFSDLCMKLKSKDLTYARISRALIHILLDITSDKMNAYVENGYNYYIKILGFKQSASALLHELKHRSSLPVISKNADADTILRRYYMSDNLDSSTPAPPTSVNPKKEDALYNCARMMFNDGTSASELYNKAACIQYRQPFISEYEHRPVII